MSLLNFFGVKARQIGPSLVAIAGTKIDEGGYQMRGGVCVVDISEPATPTLAGAVLAPTNTGFYGMALRQEAGGRGQESGSQYLYAAGGPLGIHIIDFIDPAQPRISKTYDVPGPGWCWDVFVAGNVAYVADAQAGIKILDINDPLAPVLLGGVDTPMNAREIIVRDEIAYVADTHGLTVIDVSAPRNPRIIGGHRGIAVGLKLQGQYAYMACSAMGMEVLDISDPANPFRAGELGNVAEAKNPATVRLDISGDRAVWANGQDGVVVADITDPTQPKRIGKVTTPGTAYDVIIVGDWVVVASSSNTIFTHKFR